MKAYIEQISRKEKTARNGKHYISVGIKVNGKWYNGFGSQTNYGWQQGDTVEVELTTANGYDNFKEIVVSNTMKEERLKNIEDRLKNLEAFVFKTSEQLDLKIDEDQDIPF